MSAECSHATGRHDESCDLVKGLEAERDKLREELETVRDIADTQRASANRLRTERDSLSDALGAAYLKHEDLVAKLHQALSSCHAEAWANGRCGDTLDTRCWACGQIEHERRTTPGYPQAPRAKVVT